jgi:hypothetical protein
MVLSYIQKAFSDFCDAEIGKYKAPEEKIGSPHSSYTQSLSVISSIQTLFSSSCTVPYYAL